MMGSLWACSSRLNQGWLVCRAVPVGARNFYRLMQNGEAALLFPGGVREVRPFGYLAIYITYPIVSPQGFFKL